MAAFRTGVVAEWPLVVVLGGIVGLAGCDLGLEQSANRYEQLNIETKKLLEVLREINSEETAKTHQAALEEAAGKVREVQAEIREAEAKGAEKKGGGMGRITNYRQANLFRQTGDSARRQIDRIREADRKAGEIVDKAVEGIEFPPPPMEATLPNG